MTTPLRPAKTTSLAPRLAALSFLASLLGSCSGDDQVTNSGMPTGPSVVVTPGQATVLLGSTLQFAAQVNNLPGGVLWRVEPGSPAPPDPGTISATGLYTAPATGSGPADFQVFIVAKSATDTTIAGVAAVTLPRIQVIAQPGFLTSVPPGTTVPYTIEVKNALDPGFELYVEGELGGSAELGTFTATGPNSAVYQALTTLPILRAYSLLVRSVQSSGHASATPFLNVRRGFPLPGAPGLHQLSPEWNPEGTGVAYVEGPPWNLVTHDAASHARSTLTSVSWSGVLYDGKISWGPDGTRLCFSEEQGGRRVLGVYSASGHTTFDPDGVSDVLDGTFLPTAPGSPESLLVVLRSGATYRLRAYPLNLGPSEPGLAIYEPPAGTIVREPDAILLDGVLHVTAVREVAGVQAIIAFAVDGTALDIVAKDPGSTGPVSRPVWTPQGIIDRITYISNANGTAYRFTFQGGTQPVRLYAEFFPEQSVDRATIRPLDVVLSRLHPDGIHRAWVVEFPPVDYLPKPSEEEELRAMSARGPWTPEAWARWTAEGAGFTTRR